MDGYTTAYPCIGADGNQAHIVPHVYQLCPHCNGTKQTHIARLVTDLATALYKSNVLEVKTASVARTEFNFDARLFISAMAAAYPEMYNNTMRIWADKTQASNISGEVISFITPVKSLHFNKSCNLDCSDNGQSNLNRLAVDAFDKEMVHGSKPKVWVTIVRTNRVKKDLARSRGAAKEKPGEEVTDANASQLDTVEGGALVTNPEPSGSGAKTAPKKTKPREAEGSATDTPAGKEESAVDSVISGNAAKQIRPSLSLAMCYSNTKPHYARYFVNLGLSKIRELCVLSRSLELRSSVTSGESIMPIPKWIPRKFIQVSSEVLLQRIMLLLADVQPEEPLFNNLVSGNQNVQNQPPSGVSPHSTVTDPMTNRGGNHLQARQPRGRGPWVGRGRGRGYQSNQGHPGYQHYQYDHHSGRRNNRRFLRGRGTHRGGFNQNHFSGGNSAGQVDDQSPVQVTPTVTSPGAPVSVNNPISAPNVTSGGSLFVRYMSKDVITKAFNDRQRTRRTAGSSVKCASTTCTTFLITGPGTKYCSVCGAHQDTVEMQQYKEEVQKINQQ